MEDERHELMVKIAQYLDDHDMLQMITYIYRDEVPSLPKGQKIAVIVRYELEGEVCNGGENG